MMFLRQDLAGMPVEWINIGPASPAVVVKPAKLSRRQFGERLAFHVDNSQENATNVPVRWLPLARYS